MVDVRWIIYNCPQQIPTYFLHEVYQSKQHDLTEQIGSPHSRQERDTTTQTRTELGLIKFTLSKMY